MVSLRDDPDEFLRSLETECAAGISPRAFAPLAEVYRLDGRLEDALRVARQGLGSYPTHVGIRLILARTLIDIGDGDGASEEYRLVLKGDPENVEAAAYLEAGAMSDVAPEPPGVSPTDDGEPVAAVDGASASRTGEQVTSLSDELQHLSELFATRSKAWPTRPSRFARPFSYATRRTRRPRGSWRSIEKTSPRSADGPSIGRVSEARFRWGAGDRGVFEPH
jgi:tetratricopeptide (TPR) repeat protein